MVDKNNDSFLRERDEHVRDIVKRGILADLETSSKVMPQVC